MLKSLFNLAKKKFISFVLMSLTRRGIIMKISQTDNISFGYKLTPRCVAKIQEKFIADEKYGEEFISNLMNTGNNMATIDYNMFDKDNPMEFFMTIPNYNINKEESVRCRDLNIEIAKTMEFKTLRKKVNKVYNSRFGTIKLYFLKKRLLADFPHLKNRINYIIQSAKQSDFAEYMSPANKD